MKQSKKRSKDYGLFWNYKGMAIKNIEGKGLGVVATQDLIEGTWVLYPGKVISVYEEGQIAKSKYSSDRTVKNYLCELKDIHGKTVYLNGHPTLKPPDCTDLHWIGAYINEASEGTNEIVNCDMLNLNKTQIERILPDDLPSSISREAVVIVQLNQDIEAGTELCTYYNRNRSKTNSYVAKQPNSTGSYCNWKLTKRQEAIREAPLMNKLKLQKQSIANAWKGQKAKAYKIRMLHTKMQQMRQAIKK